MVAATGNGEESIYVISAAAELAGMHPQTLRQYDRLGLVSPRRAKGRGRRYSQADIARLRQIQTLSKEDGVNLAGIQQIIALEEELEQLRSKVQELLRQVSASPVRRVFTADSSGRIHPRSPRPGRPASSSRQLEKREDWYSRLPRDLQILFALSKLENP